LSAMKVKAGLAPAEVGRRKAAPSTDHDPAGERFEYD